MSAPVFPHAPPNMPQYAPSFAGALCRYFYLQSGWRVVGEIPNVSKLVAIAAPHSSNWDVFWGLLVKIGLRLDVRFIGKREAFFWPLGSLLRGFGGIAIDRRHAQKVVPEMAALFARNEKLWLAIAPEGTRSKTESLQQGKMGAAFLASKSGYPVLPVALTGTEDRGVVENLKKFRRSKIKIVIGKPFTIEIPKGKGREEALRQVTDEIMCQIAAMLPEKYRGVYADSPRTLELLKKN